VNLLKLYRNEEIQQNVALIWDDVECGSLTKICTYVRTVQRFGSMLVDTVSRVVFCVTTVGN
jgi:hypothetical protein